MKKQTEIITYDFEAGEFPWEISEGKTVMAWGFNQQVPGPVIKAKVGDTVVVKLSNKLNEATMVHWHGITLPASMDGTHGTQKPIEPGEVFEYRFTVNEAGTFWYHSHYNETVQMERGMYGAIVVSDESDPVVDNDRIFMIDDMKLNRKSEFKESTWFLPRMVERHDGRQGDTLLLNGKESLNVKMNGGQTERWRFINSSSARYFNLSLEGREFRIIASDGGLIEYPRTVNSVLITPGERVDIAVGPFKERETFNIESLPYNRTTFLRSKKEVFATVEVGKNKAGKALIPENLRTIEALADFGAVAGRTIELSVDPRIRNGDFKINRGVHVVDKPVFTGELQIWEIVNSSLMDHPFHLHGFFFQVIEENGVAPGFRAWKDTYNIKPKSRVKIAWMPDGRVGKWMYHCHIIEHHAAGMMAMFEVRDRDNHIHPEHETHTCHAVK